MNARTRLFVLLALPFAACVSSDEAETGKPDDTAPTDEPDPVEGCTEGDGPAVDVEASLTDIATVVRVRWRTEEETRGQVHFLTATGARETVWSAGTVHEVLLVGNRALTDVSYRIVTDASGEVSCGEPRTITTGALPSGPPALRVEVDPDHVVEGGGYTIAPIIRLDSPYVAIVDSGGQYVWAWADPSGDYGGTYFNADLDLARGGIWVNEQAVADESDGYVRHVNFDGALAEPVPVPGGHTDFLELPDGSIASLSWDIREYEGSRYLGDRIVEVSPTGAVREVWNVWDHYTPAPDEDWPSGFYVPDPEVLDWSHVNAISYSAAEDAYFVSLPFLKGVARVERATGETTWLIEGLPRVENPHSVQFLGDTVLVFNRGDVTNETTCSGANEIRIADGEIVWSYLSDRCLLVPFLGNAQRLADGNTLLVFSSAGELNEVSPSGDVMWRLNLDLGAAFGFSERVDSLYPEE